MSEMQLRPRQWFYLMGVVLTVYLIGYLVAHRHCPMPEYLEKFPNINKLPKIYAITPTYARPVQKAELTRLSHALMLVPNVHWIVVEDANQQSSLVTDLLKRTGLSSRSTQLNAKTPEKFKLKGKDPNWVKPRGVEQRNAGLEWIRNNCDANAHALVYFMDDDNTYSLELFHEISLIEPGRVGVWPVGLVGGLKVEKPLLNNENKVTGFNSAWRPERPFPIDMAGFAIAVDLLLKRPEAVFTYDVQRGYQESEILRHLTTLNELQPMANLCRSVYVWHTRTEKPKLNEEDKLSKAGRRSDDGMEV